MTDLPAAMACVEIKDKALRPTERPVPTPGPGEVLIRVAAAGVNRPDVLQRKGLYPPPEGVSDLPGLEVAGTVATVGPGITEPAVGTPVCALLAGGGYAEYATAPAAQCLPVPAGLDMTQAAALPETAFTVWHNLFERGGLQAGQWALVHGGTSGIGTTAIQLATAFGARVVATAGSAEKVAACARLGAARAVNYREEDFVEVALEATGGVGVDVVLDMVGGAYVPRNLAALAEDGRHVSIAFLGGKTAEIDIQKLMRKRPILTGSTLRARPIGVKAAIAEALRTTVWPVIAAGTVAPVIDATYPLAEAAKAHARMEDGGHIGKLVLTVS